MTLDTHTATLVDMFLRNAESHPGDPAVFAGADAPALGHAALFQAIAQQAASLEALGVQPGGRVLLLAPNRAEVLVLLGAVAWLGAILVPLNLRLSPAEMAQQSRDAGPCMAVIDVECEALWNAAWPGGMPGVRPLPLDAASWPALACAGAPSMAAAPRRDAHDLPVLMLYTAAVGGHARGAVLAQSQLVASAAQIAGAWALGPDDRWLGVLPLFHAAGMGLALALLHAGGACVLLPRFDPAAAVAALARQRVTVCATFAPMLGTMLDASEAAGASLASLRIVMGLETPGAIERLAAMAPGAGFWSAYGQAEVSAMVCLGLQREKPGAAGRAIAPSLLRIQDAAGSPVMAGVEGEIAVSGPTVFLGYWDASGRRPVKPAGVWHRTGDLGRIDADGWLWFVGRAAHKQLIKTGGENVYPAEVEQALLEHPAVAEAFVFGKPDGQWGESVHAACALKPGQAATGLELIAFVEQRLARYKRPRTIRFLPAPLERHG